MAEIRRLTVAMEGEDRHEVATYVAMVLQKLADMNQLFLGERVGKTVNNARESCWLAKEQAGNLADVCAFGAR